MPLQVSANGNSVTISTAAGDAFRQTQSAAANNPLDSLTLSQALTFIDTNVTDLNSARQVLKHLTKLIFLQRAEDSRNA